MEERVHGHFRIRGKMHRRLRYTSFLKSGKSDKQTVSVTDGKVTDRFMEFLKPAEEISPMITQITGITNEMVAHARNTKEVIDDFMGFCGEEVLLGHNILFDYKFMKRYACKYQHSFERRGIDTLKIARKVHKDLESRSLEALCAHYQIKNDAAHRHITTPCNSKTISLPGALF